MIIHRISIQIATLNYRVDIRNRVTAGAAIDHILRMPVWILRNHASNQGAIVSRPHVEQPVGHVAVRVVCKALPVVLREADARAEMR